VEPGGGVGRGVSALWEAAGWASSGVGGDLGPRSSEARSSRLLMLLAVGFHLLSSLQPSQPGQARAKAVTGRGSGSGITAPPGPRTGHTQAGRSPGDATHPHTKTASGQPRSCTYLSARITRESPEVTRWQISRASAKHGRDGQQAVTTVDRLVHCISAAGPLPRPPLGRSRTEHELCGPSPCEFLPSQRACILAVDTREVPDPNRNKCGRLGREVKAQVVIGIRKVCK